MGQHAMTVKCPYLCTKISNLFNISKLNLLNCHLRKAFFLYFLRVAIDKFIKLFAFSDLHGCNKFCHAFWKIFIMICSCTAALKSLKYFDMIKFTLVPWHFDPCIDLSSKIDFNYVHRASLDNLRQFLFLTQQAFLKQLRWTGRGQIIFTMDLIFRLSIFISSKPKLHWI